MTRTRRASAIVCYWTEWDLEHALRCHWIEIGLLCYCQVQGCDEPAIVDRKLCGPHFASLSARLARMRRK